MERIPIVTKYAKDMMYAHQLHEWTFKYNKRTNVCGLCYDDTKEIQLSQHYVSDPLVPLTVIFDTVLHEIAHALAGWEAAHGPKWKETALRIGCSGLICNPVWFGLAPKYHLACPCGKVHFARHRRPIKRQYSCQQCGGIAVIVKSV